MSKVKAPKRVVVEDSEESSESDLPVVTKGNKADKKNVVEKKKVAKKAVEPESSEEEDTPVVKKAQKGRKASVDQESSVSKDKVKKAVKPSPKVGPNGKKSAKMVAESSEESESEEVKKPTKVVPKTAASKTKKVVVPECSEESESDEIIEQPKKKAQSPKVTAKSPKTQPKPSPKVAPKAAKKPVASDSQQESESEEQVKPAKKQAKIINQKPAHKNAKKVSSEEEESEEENVKPNRKGSKDSKKVAKKVEQVKESSEEEEQVKPVRKSSRDSLKIKGKKVEQDEEGEFEVCVQQMSYHAFDNDLKAHFEQCGEVLSSRVLTKPDGKSKGTGFVKFGSKSAYTKALELDGSDLCGRPIKVSEAQNRTDNARTNGGGFGARQDNGRQNSRPQQSFESNANIESNTLFIGGLSYGSTVESMKQHFGSCGEVLSARIVTDRETGKNKGFGYIEFADVESAKNAYQNLNGSNLDGRQVRLDAATPRSRPEGGQQRGGGGFNNRGGFGGRNDLSQDDRNMKSGAIGTFAGKKVML